MNKTSVLGGLVGLFAAMNVSCSTQKPHTGKLDDKPNSVTFTGEPSQEGDGGSAPQPSAPESRSMVPEGQSQAVASEPQAVASEPQALAPEPHTPAPKSQAFTPASQTLQLSSPFAQEQAQEQAFAPPFQQQWQGQTQDQELTALPPDASPWDVGQQSSDGAQFTSGAQHNQQLGVGENPSAGSQLEPLNQEQALEQVNQRYAAEGRDGVLALTEKKLLMVEKDLAAINEQNAAQYKQQIEQNRAQWQALSQVSDDNDFVQQAANLLRDLSDVAVTMSNSTSAEPRA